jgi:cobalt/nickel transport system permease protein
MLASDLLDRHADLGSPVHRVDARVKVVCATALIVAVLAVPMSQNWRLALLAGLMLALAAVSRLPASWIAKRVLILLPFLIIAAVLVPLAPVLSPADELAVPQLGLTLSRVALSAYVAISGKCLLVLLAATLLVGATRTVDLLRAGQALGLPRTITALMGFAATYLTVLSEEAARMLTARDSRGKVRGLRRSLAVAGSMLRVLMVRTFERGERVALAMVSRGYKGRMPDLERAALPLAHLLGGVAFVVLLALLYVFPRLS